MNTPINTQYQDLKTRLTEIYNTLLNAFETDITPGLEDGTYEKEENTDNLALIEEAKQALTKFVEYRPEIYIYIEGGNIQGISATESIGVNIFDHDNYNADPKEYDTDPETWDNDITSMTETKEIKSVF